METENNNLVFGLDIGTRNVVGTVGYREEDNFYVMAQFIRQHKTRSMLDGQIHDIGKVGDTIRVVKEELEEQIGDELHEVCIAAAGRVLKTVTTTVVYEFPEETVVTAEHIHTMDLLGIEQAQKILQERNDTRYRFYCVGYSVVKYYLNDEHFISIESHKADKIAEDIIVTFLPEDVVDGLYSAVAKAGLEVANMTLEPIAAINIAIPESFRMLNLALVDVGAGTSDISITKDGSIIAYGMIPYAGDEVTELIVQSLLVDFKTAEKIKMDAGVLDEVEYKDIMGILHKVPAQEIWDMVDPVVEKITTEIAKRIKELNGDVTVSATFIVGGGGKVHGFAEKLADKLELPRERVALRGEEVLQEVIFEQEDIVKDPLLVTPIGICLNYYEQKNNFIMVHFNGERIKLYDNNKLTIVDAAMEAGFPNDQLFPRTGKAINFIVNGKKRLVRGEAGEPAIIKMNDRSVNINEPLEPNSYITMEPSTAGAAAKCTIEDLEEYTKCTMRFIVNGKVITCPKFMEVNGNLEPPFYEIQEGDVIESRNYYTINQLAEFMDVKVDRRKPIYVNNEMVTSEALVYENFSVDWYVREEKPTTSEEKKAEDVQTHQEILRKQEEDDFRASHIGEGAQRQLDAAENRELLEEDLDELEDLGEIEDPLEYGTKTEETVENLQNDPQDMETEVVEEEQEIQKPDYEKYADELEELGKYVDEMNKADEESEKAALRKKPVIEEVVDGVEELDSILEEDDKPEPVIKAFETSPNGYEEEIEPEGLHLDVNALAAENQEMRSEQHSLQQEKDSEEDVENEREATDEQDSKEDSDMEEEKTEEEESDTNAYEYEDEKDTYEQAYSEDEYADDYDDAYTDSYETEEEDENFGSEEDSEEEPLQEEPADAVTEEGPKREMEVFVNHQPVTLTGKSDYIFVDVFQFFDFDLADSRGRAIITKINGTNAQFSQKLSPEDKIEIYWKEN